MAEQKKAVATKAAPSKGTKFLDWCKALPGKIAKPFKDMANEMKRVTWPTKRKLIIYSVIVLVFMVCMGIVIGLFDLGGSALIRVLGNINA